MDLVLKLREIRRMRNLSQKDVARLSGVGEKTISSFETGQRIGSLKLAQLNRLLKVYGLSETEFFGAHQGCDDDVATGLQLTVHLHDDPVAQIIEHQDLLRFRLVGLVHVRLEAVLRQRLREPFPDLGTLVGVVDLVAA